MVLLAAEDPERHLLGEPVQHPQLRGREEHRQAEEGRRQGQVGHRAGRRQRILQPQQE